MNYIRNDGKVKAELVFNNGTIACYHATWDKGSNRYTTRSSESFAQNFKVIKTGE